MSLSVGWPSQRKISISEFSQRTSYYERCRNSLAGPWNFTEKTMKCLCLFSRRACESKRMAPQGTPDVSKLLKWQFFWSYFPSSYTRTFLGQHFPEVSKENYAPFNRKTFSFQSCWYICQSVSQMSEFLVTIIALLVAQVMLLKYLR